MSGRERKRERDRERDRERQRERQGEHEIGEGRKSPAKTDVPKLHASNECEHPVLERKIETNSID